MKRLYLACMLSLRGCRSYWIPGSYAPTWSEKRTSVLKAIEKEGLQGGTGDNNWVGRHRHIHDPGIQQEPLTMERLSPCVLSSFVRTSPPLSDKGDAEPIGGARRAQGYARGDHYGLLGGRKPLAQRNATGAFD